MKKYLLTLFFFGVFNLLWGQYPATNLNFLFNGTIQSSDSTGIDSLTGVSNSQCKFLDVDFDITLGYIPGKTNAKVVIYGDTVPINVLFNNYNYADTLYFQWLDKQIDSDSLEILPYRLQRIAHYSTATTDVNDFFETPAKPGGAIYVAANGNDGTGDGSEGNPYLTISTGIANAGVLGFTVAKSNNYNEYIYNLYANSIKGVGRVSYTSTNVTYGARLRYDSDVSFENIIVNDGLETSASIYGQNADNLDIIRVYSNSGSSNSVLGDYANIEKSVFSGTNSSFGINNTTGTQDRMIQENYFTNTSQSVVYNPNNMGELTLLNNNVNCSSTGRFVWNLNTSNPVNIIGNNVELTGASFYVFSDGNLGGLRIKSNIFDVNLTTDEVIYINDHVTNPALVEKNTFNIQSNVDETVIYSENSVIESSSNKMYHFGEIALNAEILNLMNTTGTYDYFTAKNNKIFSRRIGGYNIAVGSEGTSPADNDIQSIEISENYIKGRQAYASPGVNATHGIFVGFQINADVKYNYTYGAGFSTILKGSLGTTFTENGVHYNIHREFLRGVYCKGSSGVNIYNNTFFSDNITPNYAIQLAENIGGDSAINCNVKNNIFVYLGSGTYNPIELLNNSTGHNIDYNSYYCPNGTLQFINENGVRTFAQWQSDGNDANSHILTNDEYNNLFNDPSNGDFSVNNMPYFGENLSSNYNQGLSENTVWGDSTQTPNVINVQQVTNNWSIGAYIQDSNPVIEQSGNLIVIGNGKAVILK